MGLDAMERITAQMKMNLQGSNQRNQETLQKLNEKEQKKNLSEENSTNMRSLNNLRELNTKLKSAVKCDKCKDTGWILIPQEHSQPLAVSCECRKVQKLKSEWKTSGINTEMSTQTFSNFEVWNKFSQMAKDTAIAYYHDFDKVRDGRKNSILLCGQVGSGKTHLAVALALNLLKQKIKVVYMPYRDVLTKIKQNMLDDEYYTKMISKYQTCDVLLIDDLFKGKVNDSDINIIFEMINYRYLNHLPMIISSEFTINRLLYFDEGIGSRIYEMCKNYVVQIEKDQGNNYRLR